MPEQPTMRPAGSAWLGAFLALLSAVSFASNVPFVGIVYNEGGNIHAVNLVRPLFFLACVGAWALARRRPVDLPARQGNSAFLLGALFCVEFYAVHTAIQTISVGLAILIMYTYPILVAIVAAALNRTRLRLPVLLGMLVAFIGLSVALGATAVDVDWQGVAWALIAALGMCAIVTISERTTEGHDNISVMFHTMLIASLIMLSLVVLGVTVEWPQSTTGLQAMIASTVLYAAATAFLFVAVDLVGPVRFAVIDNTSPIWASLAGYLLLAETLTWQQGAGALMVIGGVIAVQILHPHR